jgi:Gram-negative bacterial TonB protein C-terminal
VINWQRFSRQAVLITGLFSVFVAINSAYGWMVPAQNVGATPVPMRVRVSQSVSTSFLVKRVNPDYSKDLKKQRIQGMVTLRLFISKEGDVVDVKPISGDPALVKISVDAVKQWKYRPYLLNQEPVEVETQIHINYTLAGS